MFLVIVDECGFFFTVFLTNDVCFLAVELAILIHNLL